MLLAFFILTEAKAQCPPNGDVYLNSQADVDQFIANYGTCTEINGNLWITTGSSVINDLSGLTALEIIRGRLFIETTSITNLNGFDNLIRVEGDLTIRGNNAMTEILGFPSLQEITGELRILENQMLVQVDAFDVLESVGDNIWVTANNFMTSLAGFENLVNVDGRLDVSRNDRLAFLSSFPALVTIGNDLVIAENDDLVLVDGFNLLETIGWDLNINSTSIAGFQSLREINRYTYFISVESIPDFESLTIMGAGIEFNNTTITEVSGFNNVEEIGSLGTGSDWFIFLDNSEMVRISGFNSLRTINGVIQIIDNDKLEGVQGLSSLEKVGGLVQFNVNPSLLSLEGLENLVDVAELQSSVDSGLLITDNTSLVDCSAICNLLVNGTIGGQIDISGNPSQCSTEAEVRQNCIMDFDGDGIEDADDLDDDNDGITDVDEDGGITDRDTDADGSPDSRDWDSDGDGCFDVVEAGFTDVNSDGILGDLPTEVDANGLVINTTDVYTTPNDLDSNSIFDFQENTLLNAGQDNSISVCVNEAAFDLFTVLNGSPSVGGVWSPALSSGTSMFDPLQDGTGIYTYTVDNSICGTVSSQVAIQVVNQSNAGTDGMISLCSNDVPIDLFDLLGNNPDLNGSWSPSLASGTGVFDPNVDSQGIYTYTITNSVCGQVSSQVEVIVDLEPNTGTDGVLTICSDGAPTDLFLLLGGNPDSGGVWSPALSGGNGLFNPALDTAGTYTYSISNALCGTVSSQVEVVIDALPNPGTDELVDICINAAPTDLFQVLGGNPDAGGVWSPSLASGTGLFDPTLDAAGTYVYTVSNGVCDALSSQVEVTISQLTNPGTNGSLSICSSGQPVDLFSLLGDNPDSGGVWSPTLTSGTGIYDPHTDVAGIYTYTLDNGICGTVSSEVNVELFDTFQISNFEIETIDFQENNRARIIINEPGEYEYSLDNSTFQSSNAFLNLEGGDYTFYVRQVNGCGRLEQEFTILDYPKFFTPNNDNINDSWQLKGRTSRIYTISIFNRYGKLMKILNNSDPSWQGDYNGVVMPSSDYWFVIKFEDGASHRGHFALLRR